jgi:predicted transposase/invertase (TIGR01784 family)
MGRLLPTNDLAFKKVFASEDSGPILQGFISDFFGFTPPLESIRVQHPYTIDSYRQALDLETSNQPVDEATAVKLHQTLRDLTVSCVDGDVIVEVQVSHRESFIERCLFYLFSKYVDNYGLDRRDGDYRVNKYGSLRPVRSLNILSYTEFKTDDDALRFFELWDRVHGCVLVGSPVQLGFFELKKQGGLNGRLRAWRDFFLELKVSPDAPSYIQEAADRMNHLNLTGEERAMIDRLEKAQQTYNSELNYAYNDGKRAGELAGLQKGLRQGREEVNEMVNRMRSLGMDEKQIAQIVGHG